MNLSIDLLKAIFSATFWASVFLAYILFRRREAAGAKYLSKLMLSCAIWTGGILLGLVSNSVTVKNVGMMVVYLGSIFVPSLLLAFVLDFTGLKGWLKWRYFIPLNLFAITVLAFSIIPSTQYLLWEIEHINAINNTTTHINGPLYIFWVSYAYLIYAFSLFLLFRKLKGSSTDRKRQISVFIIGILPPIIFHLIFLFQSNPSNFVNPTPLGFALAVGIIFFGIYNFEVFSLVPVARQKIIEKMSDPVIVTNKYSRIVMHNESFKKLFGKNNQKLIGTYLENVFPFIHDLTLSTDNETFSSNIEYNYDGKTFDMTIDPIKKDSQVEGKVIVLHDISNQKKIVEQLNMVNIHLKNELAFNETLIGDLNAFSHTVAHNLKEPLNNIIGFCNLISTSSSENITNEFLYQIYVTSTKMNLIIDELLLMSKISKEEVMVRSIDMKSVVEEAISRNELEILNRNALIKLPDGWPEVSGYASWITEVWSNLISNALKYGGERPQLTFGFKKENNNEVIFYLKDNGKGLSKSQIDKLFIPFCLLENSEEGSHGLGLSIVKRIITKLNGRVWAESDNNPGNGSTFFFTLQTS